MQRSAFAIIQKLQRNPDTNARKSHRMLQQINTFVVNEEKWDTKEVSALTTELLQGLCYLIMKYL